MPKDYLRKDNTINQKSATKFSGAFLVYKERDYLIVELKESDILGFK